MSRYSIQDFVQATAQQNRGEGLFELESERMLEVNLNGMMWIKKGAMVAYRGGIKFTREGVLEHGMGKALKKAFTGEGAQLTRAEGRGQLYLADKGKKVTILNLEGQAICINGNDLLAFESNLTWDIKMIRKLAGMMAGGLFNIRLEGHGMVAITTYYDPLTLKVSPHTPVFTDPGATVAWSGHLKPDFHTDVSMRTFLGRGSGESFQMVFSGDGFVVVQPFEESGTPQQSG